MSATLLALALAAASHNKERPHVIPTHAILYEVVEAPRCSFRYDDKLETRTLTILQREQGADGARFYDATRPLITICRAKAELMFSGTKKVGGTELLDPSHVFIDVDICSHRILSVSHDDGITVTDDSPCE